MTTSKMVQRTAIAVASIAVALFAGCKDNPTTTDPNADVSLAAPPAGQGYQIKLGPFDVAANTEVQRNYYMKFPADSDVYITKVEFKFNPGSHHLNIFKTDSVDLADHIEDSFSALQFQNWDMVAASQAHDLVWQLPAGVAIKIKAHQQMDFQTHYVNAGTQATPSGHGLAYINFWTTSKSNVTSLVGAVFSNNKTLNIPAHTAQTYCKVVPPFTQDVNLLLMTGHFHSRGRSFTVGHWNGTKLTDTIYRSNDWSDPPILKFSSPLLIHAGDSLAYMTTYENRTDAVIKFGPHVETEEHANLFTFYYPGPASGKAIYDFVGGVLVESHPL